MSLEQKIEELNVSIIKLISVMAGGVQTPKAEAPKAEAPKAEAPKAEAPKAEAPKAEPDEPEQTEGPKVSFNDLKAQCQKLVGLGGRDAMVSLNEALGIEKLSELPESRYGEGMIKAKASCKKIEEEKGV